MQPSKTTNNIVPSQGSTQCAYQRVTDQSVGERWDMVFLDRKGKKSSEFTTNCGPNLPTGKRSEADRDLNHRQLTWNKWNGTKSWRAWLKSTLTSASLLTIAQSVVRSSGSKSVRTCTFTSRAFPAPEQTGPEPSPTGTKKSLSSATNGSNLSSSASPSVTTRPWFGLTPTRLVAE